MNTASAKPSTDEPEIVQVEAIPSDGKDLEGEEMMKSVRNEKLEIPAEPADES